MAGYTSPPPNYFTCTLGEAAVLNAELSSRSFPTINELIDAQARDHGPNWAVGFPVPSPEQGVWAFADLKDGTVLIAEKLSHVVNNGSKSTSSCVALLCPSSVNFLFTWLALIRLGYSVLLIAPQCEPEAISHLCKSCDVQLLLSDNAYLKLAHAAVEIAGQDLIAHVLPWQSDENGEDLVNIFRKNVPLQNENHSKISEDTAVEDVTVSLNEAQSSAVAYIHHTSGTSSGLPKPIPQTHHAAVGVLPSLDGTRSATFTTTPLYHGGVADCFRAWTSGALIWLFPGADAPITARTILSSIEAASKAAAIHAELPPIRYFSSVPYILQLLTEESHGSAMLKEMDIVGVGGAALPSVVGDDLVQQNVNLVSRFGAAECGFLLCSHRDYAQDLDWQYLRVPSTSQYISFEQQDDGSGLSELVIRKGWPHMAKTNRDDGSYATSDLFESHPTIPRAWKYHSRSDSQITLITGKKFDPAPIEEDLAASSDLIREVMIVGNGKQQAAALIFATKPEQLDERALEARIFELVEVLNEKGQAHTRIPKSKMNILYSTKVLPRSSKGTLLRRAAYEDLATEIDALYEASNDVESIHTNGAVETKQIPDMIEKIVHDIVGAKVRLTTTDDFFSHGIDSAMCTQIRTTIQKEIFQNQHTLPWNIVYDCGNVDRLAHYLQDRIEGKETTRSDTEEMLELVNKYSVNTRKERVASTNQTLSEGSSVVIMLTGATGALGCEILHLLRIHPSVSKIMCLVRADDYQAARARVSDTLKKRRKPTLLIGEEKVWCLPSQLHQNDLGLSEQDFGTACKEVTHVVHAAWNVNFSLALRSFEENIAGVRSLIQFTSRCSHEAQMIFCSSTASVLGASQSPSLSYIPETISESPTAADSLGYSKSKWVAESICANAAATSNLQDRIKVLRIGQLTGDTRNGVWNMTEAWPLMLSTGGVLGCLPRLEESLNWLPMDIAAQAVIDISLTTNLSSTEEQCKKEGSSCPVYHICSNSTATSWLDLLTWIKNEGNQAFEIVEPRVWIDRLEALDEHPAKNLLGLWKAAYGKENGGRSGERQAARKFETGSTERASEAMRVLAPVDEDLVRKIWVWLTAQ